MAPASAELQPLDVSHSPGGADHTDARRHVQSSQPPPWTPIVPIHKRVSSPRRRPALVSRTGGTARDHGPPVLLPEVRRKRFLASLGERSSRCLRGAEAAPRRPRFPVKCSGLRRWVSCGSGCIYSRGARRPFYSPRAQKWKGWCLCGGPVFPEYEMQIHL